MRVKHIPLTIDGKDFIAELVEKDNKQMVAIKPICQAIGIDRRSQQVAIQNNPQYRWGVITLPSNGGPQDMFCLPVEEIGMWLCQINSKRVRKEVREILLQFQKRCQVELHEALVGRAGIDKVKELEGRVGTLESQIAVLTEALRLNNLTIEALQNQLSQYNDAEQVLASVGGKMMARARKTRHLRAIH